MVLAMAMARARAMAMAMAGGLTPISIPVPHIPVLGDRVPPGAQGGIDSRCIR